MKKFFTLFLLFFAVVFSATSQTRGRLTVTNLGIRDVWIELDGKRYDDQGNQIVIRSLSIGNHRLKVYRGTRRANSPFQRPSIIYENNLNVKPQYHTDIVVNRFGKVLVDELSMRDREYDGDNESTTPLPGDRPDRNPVQISDESFARLIERIKREPFSDEKKLVARQAIDGSWFSVSQVKELLRQWPFDDDRLDLAKRAYSNTINKTDYFEVEELLNLFSRDKLRQYIRDYHNR